jgi:hypothetical protein
MSNPSGASEPESPAVVRVDHGDLQLAFLPGVGGRLLSLRHGDREVLWQNPARVGPDLEILTPPATLPPETGMASWWNFGGSKTWPAPQYDGEGLRGWNGPPDPVLDGGAYALELERTSGTTMVTLTSPPDQRSGLQIVRRFLLDRARPDGFEERISLRNISGQPVTWSAWEVCQVATGRTAQPETISVDVEQHSEVLQLASLVGEPVTDRGVDGATVAVQPVVAKWGFRPPASTITFDDAEISLSLTFTTEPGSRYPEGGCCAELWMQYPTAEPIAGMDNWRPDAAVVELEVLGPLVALAPAEEANLVIGWTLRRR